MSDRPLQFSMRVLVGEVALVGFAAALIAREWILMDLRHLDTSLPLAGAILGAMIGLPLRRPFKGATTGALIAIVLPMYVFPSACIIGHWVR